MDLLLKGGQAAELADAASGWCPWGGAELDTFAFAHKALGWLLLSVQSLALLTIVL